MTGSSIGLENPDVAKALQAQLDVIGAALDASKDGFAIWKAMATQGGAIEEFELVLMNSAGAAAAGKPQQELVGRTLTAVVGAETAKDLRGIFIRALREGQGVREVVPGFSPEFGHGLYENTVVPFGDNLVFATYRDVSDAEKERSRLLWLSEHDFLTGMPNRAKLQESLAKSVADARQSGNLIAFVFIDIDFFKKVNDSHGHEVGDILLVNFVKRIRHSLPERALVARIAGDEFAILLEEIKHEAHLRDLMQEVFEAMQRPFVYGDIEMSITCSAGCVVSDGSEQVDELMRIADKAMYQAKHQGRARFTVEKAIKTT
jgi:diguanylate cyclase (GGDEF)-like protein